MLRIPPIRIKPLWLVLGICALLLPWLLIWNVTVRLKLFPKPAQPLASASAPAPLVSSHVCNPGPWGELNSLPILIDPPAEYIQELAYEGHPSTWYFPSTSLDELKGLCQKAALSENQTALLLGNAKPEPKIAGFSVIPTTQLTESLTPASRETLYCALAQHNENVDQVNAFRTAADIFPEWLQALPVSSGTRDLIQRLHYRRGAYYFFSDLPLVLSSGITESERAGLLRALSQESTTLLWLHLDAKSDIDALTAYWGRGGHENDVRPILEAVAKVPGGNGIDIVQLLPPFARRRLFTYPLTSLHPNIAQDCHWSSANFYNDEPDPRFLDKKIVAAMWHKDYDLVLDHPLFGDLVLFEKKGQIIHSAVFIADDFVFTKNGSRASSPWMFMRIQAVHDYYQSDPPLNVHFMRRIPHELK